MTTDLLLALVLFALVSSITPGPNNMMLLASGANFGVRRSLPHILGVSLGHAAMILILGAGLMGVFEAFPILHRILTVVSVLYLCWLAWKLAHAAAPEGNAGTGKPLTFLQAAAFQWVNPKGWAMALTAIVVYAPDRNLSAVAVVAGVFACTNLPSVSVWTVLGMKLRLLLTNQRRLTIFNWTMAILLVVATLPILLA